MQMPADMGPVHILGIGGIGMSAIAEILHSRGYTVQGSDQKDSANVKRLRAKGIRVFVGHDAVNLVGARYVVISSAVKPGTSTKCWCTMPIPAASASAGEWRWTVFPSTLISPPSGR